MRESSDMRALEDTAFRALLIVVSLAFGVIVWPLYGAVLWAGIMAIIFAPLQRKLLRTRMRLRPNLVALATLLVIVLIVILPLLLIGLALLQETSTLYGKVASGELNLVESFPRIVDGLPEWAAKVVRRLGLTSLGATQEILSTSVLRSSKYLAGQAVSLGQGALEFFVSLCVMLYLLFFLLRDGDVLSARLRRVIPLSVDHKNALLSKFTTVIRASVKGDLLVALLQGALGGLIFWLLGLTTPLLWAVVMAFLSLLPVVGAALVWLPVAVYLLATGAFWSGWVLIAYGALVIGLVDNVVRPILVGNDAKMPAYVVLVSTLGGIAWFGFNGLVIGPVIAATFMAAWDLVSAPDKAAPR